MPIYEYNCAKCGNCFEYLHFAGDDAPPECPKCGAREVKRQLSCFATGAGGQGGGLGSLSGLGHGSGGGCGSGGFS